MLGFSRAVDIGRISGKFLPQSSARLAGRIGWHVALLGRRAGAGDSQSPDAERRTIRAGAVSGCQGFGPGKGPGGSVDNGDRARDRRAGSGPKVLARAPST